ncbi:MAG: hypothetical protein IT531_14355 [Burkholderiales bacterium]|nr:hypothetical protein [Burkholderiales bacterium]
MRTLAELETAAVRVRDGEAAPVERSEALLALAEATLEHWLLAHDLMPTGAKREGFRLLALHRQGSRDDPSFNACRETCREIVYHHNVIAAERVSPEAPRQARLMAMLVLHLILFVGGKLQNAKLGEFCCSARPLHAETNC